MEEQAKVAIGDTVTDKVTGFTGIAIGRCEYLTGVAQIQVQPPMKADGEFVEARWFDEPRFIA